MATRWVPDRPVITAFSRNRATLLVARTAGRVEASAKTLAPVRQPNENGRLGGRLRSSIGTRIGGTAYVVTARVGSKVKYAEPAHQGAEPHVIRPRRKQFLSFKWNKAKQYGIPLTKRGMVQFKKVNHPGMRGSRYLAVPLMVHGRLGGFRVTVTRKAVG